MRRSVVVSCAIALACASACVGATGGAWPAAQPAPARDVLADILASPDLDGARASDASGPPGAAAPAPHATVVVVFASWCSHCHDEIAVLGAMISAHPALRVIGVNYRGHEEYDARGNSDAVRNYVRNFAPWMRVVPAGEQLFDELGRPPRIPTVYVYDARGALVEVYDRQYREPPDRGELESVLGRLGA